MLKIGVVGGRRGELLSKLLPFMGDSVQLVAVADLSQNVLDEWKTNHPDIKLYQDPSDLFCDPTVDAVYIATPMAFHAQQAIDALQVGKHVLCEVPACLTIEEGRKLIETVNQTKCIYMLAENYCFIPEHQLIKQLCYQHQFGEIVYVRGSYIHDCKELMFYSDSETLTWRGELSCTHFGNVYPTHSIGPIAQWLQIGKPNGDQFKCITSFTTSPAALISYISQQFDSQHPLIKANRSLRGDVNVSIIETIKGCLIELLYDTHSNRPPNRAECLLQGIDGCYISGRYDGEEGVIWLNSQQRTFTPLSRLLQKPDKIANLLGKHYPDYLMLQTFCHAILSGCQPEIGVREAVLWSSIIPLSHNSVIKGNVPVEFPIF